MDCFLILPSHKESLNEWYLVDAPIGRGAGWKREVVFIFVASDLACGWFGEQQLIVAYVGFMVSSSIRSMREDVVVEGLKIKLALQCRAEYTVPVCPILDSSRETSAVYSLLPSDFRGIE